MTELMTSNVLLDTDKVGKGDVGKVIVLVDSMVGMLMDILA